ncbi:PREDICTED: F-box/kelch-repeat protein At1g51550 [Nelumbo nucifera]|uniref:F-box/kelch-repeat protein At1g51550 n=1 Tax=Nelumbo nucifera TaxID=4432 RepID=A0A1U8BAU2_NELNU|nr:PREDICTED: F-box/kelch-repeat protein At1g51550 [Nelumbo nucifera]
MIANLQSAEVASSMADNCSKDSNQNDNTSRSSSNNNNKSFITHIAHDHLISILLLLPIDSILSFAMTCKRFKSLASSDTLWESICRRDWGNSHVDAFLASAEIKQFPWRKIYQQVSQSSSISCRRLSGSDDGMFPSPRASHSLNFVSDCLVLFGGGCEGGRHLDDTWVAYIGSDFRRIPRWQKINSGTPSGRFGQTCSVVGDYLVLFGGINDHGIRQNDTWVGQIMCNEIDGIKLSWRLLDIGPLAPPPRGAHAECCIDDKKMVIHGGIGLDGLRLSDMWLLDISDGARSATWHEIIAHMSPPARSGHTLTCVGGTRMVLFGGRGTGYEVLNDIWLLDIAEEHPRWVQLIYESFNIPQGVPLPRVGHSATLILGGKVLIFGGEDSYRHRKDDFWVLDICAIPSIEMCSFTLNSKISSRKMWKRLKAEGHQLNCRSFHRACADRSGRYVFMFGGMVDGLLQPAEASGLRFDGELYLVEIVFHF